jgi:hypothetical protein
MVSCHPATSARLRRCPCPAAWAASWQAAPPTRPPPLPCVASASTRGSCSTPFAGRAPAAPVVAAPGDNSHRPPRAQPPSAPHHAARQPSFRAQLNTARSHPVVTRSWTRNVSVPGACERTSWSSSARNAVSMTSAVRSGTSVPTITACRASRDERQSLAVAVLWRRIARLRWTPGKRLHAERARTAGRIPWWRPGPA